MFDDRRHRDCGLLAPRLTDKIDPIRYTPKTSDDEVRVDETDAGKPRIPSKVGY
jgi:hypothetical protein